MRMKYLNGQIITSAPYKGYEDKWPQCSICDEKKMSMYMTENHKLVCFTCKTLDKEAEFVKE
jgi:hypothetical protein